MTIVEDRPVSAYQQRHQDAIKAHQVLGQLMQRVPSDIPMWRWSVCSGITSSVDDRLGVEAHLGLTSSGHARRAAVMVLAEQFGLDYADKPYVDGKNLVTASGFHDGVPVKFYDLIAPCTCENCGVSR